MNQTAFDVITIIGVSLIFTFFALFLFSWIVILIIHFRETYKEHEIKKIKIKTLTLYKNKRIAIQCVYNRRDYRYFKQIVKQAKMGDVELVVNTNIVYKSKGAKNVRN